MARSDVRLMPGERTVKNNLQMFRAGDAGVAGVGRSPTASKRHHAPAALQHTARDSSDLFAFVAL